MKTVTAILPNYNYAHYIDSRIDEVLSQTYPVSEIIILDDASTDDSKKIIEAKIAKINNSHPEIKIQAIFNKKNSGNVFAQWKKGIDAANYDHIWICEMDDSSSPDFLKNIMPGFNDEKTVLAYSNSRLVNQNDKTLIKDNLRKIKDFFRKKHSFGNYLIDGKEEINRNLAIYNSIPNVSAVVFKNKPNLSIILEKAKQFKLSGDWFFYINVAEHGKVFYCDKRLNIHRLHKSSVTETVCLKERFSEIQRIHHFVLRKPFIKETTKESIMKLEKKLREHWKIR